MKAIYIRLQAWIRMHSRTIEFIGVLGTLFIISYQSIQMNSNLEEMRKNYSLDVNRMIHEHKQRINNLLVLDMNKDLRDVFHLDKERVMYYIILNDYSNLYHLKTQDLVDDTTWLELQEMMVGQLSNVVSLREFWEGHKEFFNSRFRVFIDTKLKN